MLLLQKNKDPRILIATGQICLVLGLVGLRLCGIYSIDLENTDWNVIFVGGSAALPGLSIPLNTVGIRRIIRQKKNT